MDVHPTKNGIFIGIDPYPNKSMKDLMWFNPLLVIHATYEVLTEG